MLVENALAGYKWGMMERFDSSEPEIPWKRGAIETIKDVVELAVIGGEPFPEAQLREALSAMGCDDGYINLTMGFSRLTYEELQDKFRRGEDLFKS